MNKIKYTIKTEEFAGDMHTPVSLYLKLRDLYKQSALLECSDYHSAENARSIIALAPVASVSINHGVVKMELPDSETQSYPIESESGVSSAIEQFMSKFDIDGDYGVYGYTAFDSVKYMEPIEVDSQKVEDNDAADVIYILYRYTLVFDHFHHTLTLHELIQEGGESQSQEVIATFESRNYSSYGFSLCGDVTSPITNDDYCKMVEKGIAHCKRGDVFQIVLSRRFIQKYRGDDFAVYRKLRQINPSPYLFYFDFGGLRIFGSSPETHCKIENGVATIDPIAGTAFRVGDIDRDHELAESLLKDPKEGAEHVMLVDLARNDLSRNCIDVKVEFYKTIQYYSHVIHLVSRVSGNIKERETTIKTFMDTFPAGTLSGSPKVRAMQLISEIEPHSRGIYGGAIGYIGFDGSINQAITIRTFVSRNGQLEFQAGAGVVALSKPERELQETLSKLGALSKAIKEDINY